MADKNNGGPWGGGDKKPSGGENPWGNRPNGEQRPQGDGDFDRIVRGGQERFRRIVGGGGGNRPGSGGGTGFGNSRTLWLLVLLFALGFWVFQSFHVIQQSDRALVMRFGRHVNTWQDGLHFAPWPIYSVETLNVTRQSTEHIGEGNGPSGQDWSLMLTSDENIIDIEFEVVWRIGDPVAFRFNIQEPEQTIRAVAQSTIREVVARSNLIPLLNTQRGATEDEVHRILQENLDLYKTGIEIRRVNLTKSDPPEQVIADFKDVQAAEQERDTLSSQARALANRKLADARGEQAQLLEDAEAYKARVINQAEGDASRFVSVLGEYQKAPDVTRRRLYLESMERVYGQIDKIIIDQSASEGIVPYLPLNELKSSAQSNRTNQTEGAK